MSYWFIRSKKKDGKIMNLGPTEGQKIFHEGAQTRTRNLSQHYKLCHCLAAVTYVTIYHFQEYKWEAENGLIYTIFTPHLRIKCIN